MCLTARTRVNKIFKISEYHVDLRPFIGLLVPALFSDLPDRRGYSWGTKLTRFWWATAPSDQNDNVGVRVFGEGYLSGRKLETDNQDLRLSYFRKIDVPLQ